MTPTRGKSLFVLRAPARVFEDGVLGIKAATDLTEGDYEAVVVVQSRAIERTSVGTAAPPTDTPLEPLDRYLERMRREHVGAALERANGNRTQAAKLLGVDVRTIFRLLEKAGEGEGPGR